MQQYLQNKKGLVQSIFDQVYDKYDLMNDFMSLGTHRIWKKNLINMMNPSLKSNLIDVGCGTADIGKLFLENTSNEQTITCVDPNISMIKQGKEKLSRYKKITYTGYDLNGDRIKNTAQGLHARVVQHEIDHLDGILYTERLTNKKAFGFEKEIIEFWKNEKTK